MTKYKIIGVMDNPSEYVGELIVVGDGEKVGLVLEKKPYINTRNEIRNDRPIWTVDWIKYSTNIPHKMWYNRKAIEKLLDYGLWKS